MDLTLTASHGVTAYLALQRLVTPPTLPVAGAPVPGQPLPPPRFQVPAAVVTPQPDAGPGATAPPPIAVPQPPLATGPTSPPAVATANRATALYAQIQQLVAGAPPAQLPTAHGVATGPGPGDAAGTPPPATQNQSGGALGVTTLGGAAESAVRTMTFPRGSFVDFLT